MAVHELVSRGIGIGSLRVGQRLGPPLSAGRSVELNAMIDHTTCDDCGQDARIIDPLKIALEHFIGGTTVGEQEILTGEQINKDPRTKNRLRWTRT